MSQQFVEDYMFWLLTKKECCHNTSMQYLKNFQKDHPSFPDKRMVEERPFR
ncbi:phage integrase SAM-like domain-containing protein [Bacteroides faecis]|uniref:phage integrase SAM-like domain-containing protein n=1 Tax=Bacteroidales TaxID=171549 RepID=UPI001F01E104|nr:MULTISPECIES: phage integrase SAM-like domain-containing protein [Bacteroides]MCS2196358.1 phage integrase SAM-like domain-containing protein [Bacteroides faecis]MCS2235171.1 phage integrase SAM-like domain-containing protein [Bacteroides faecis]MCS2935797.1 phage integrase SAM-like domain-containing protein [Bacteroides faecis]MCS3067742.1 phage integrase SAM-like domain-containing protein [Bacteroides faecis]MCS3124136.1 phage integrase SAM-like domain-containing protein [Bacteroides faec